MRPFDEYYEEFSKTKKKNLQNFIDIARKIHRGEISFNQHKNVKKSNQNFIGVKRQRNDTTNNNNDIVGIIDDFIYTKRRIMNENEFEERVNFIKDKLNELIKEGIQMLNNNAFNAIVRLMRFMSCSRNFSNDTIKQSKIIEEVKEKMKSIIIMKLFDSSRLVNELTEYETISSNELIAQIDSNEEYNSKESIKESQSVSESSMILSSGSKTDYEDLKTKIKNNNLLTKTQNEIDYILEVYKMNKGYNDTNKEQTQKNRIRSNRLNTLSSIFECDVRIKSSEISFNSIDKQSLQSKK